nr:hypothetical protein Iba_chr13bCG12670 [Ipomoea batatas]
MEKRVHHFEPKVGNCPTSSIDGASALDRFQKLVDVFHLETKEHVKDPSWQPGRKVEAFAAEQRGAEMGRRCHRHPEGQTGSWSPFLGLSLGYTEMYLMPESSTQITQQ